AFGIEQRLAFGDPPDIGADLAHAIAERLASVICRAKSFGGEFSEQGERAHIRLAETGALLPAQAEQLDGPARGDVVALEAREHGKARNHAGRAVEIAALRY